MTNKDSEQISDGLVLTVSNISKCNLLLSTDELTNENVSCETTVNAEKMSIIPSLEQKCSQGGDDGVCGELDEITMDTDPLTEAKETFWNDLFEERIKGDKTIWDGDVFYSNSALICIQLIKKLLNNVNVKIDDEDVEMCDDVINIEEIEKSLKELWQNRFKYVLPKVISPNQGCCILGKDISDTVASVRDVMDLVEMDDIECYSLKLDQEKAFDRVGHEYLFAVLDKFGFAGVCKIKDIAYECKPGFLKETYIQEIVLEKFPKVSENKILHAVRNVLETIPEEYKVVEAEVGEGVVEACVPKSGNIYEITLKEIEAVDLICDTGFKVNNETFKPNAVFSKEKMVSFLNVSYYVTDEEITTTIVDGTRKRSARNASNPAMCALTALTICVIVAKIVEIWLAIVRNHAVIRYPASCISEPVWDDRPDTEPQNDSNVEDSNVENENATNDDQMEEDNGFKVMNVVINNTPDDDDEETEIMKVHEHSKDNLIDNEINILHKKGGSKKVNESVSRESNVDMVDCDHDKNAESSIASKPEMEITDEELARTMGEKRRRRLVTSTNLTLRTLRR
ncbi:unnamed protein product [Mytilus coruscus]|uniref:Reverse transcriptase domain-containing protein n=1 Tax=Mytilus coruscus TaxID=42192 RepID=A0A6J8DTQ9_MYTCO|nr:unnamed protein product [Mytilus coruscus]